MKFLHRFLILATLPAAHAWSPSQEPPAMPLDSFVLPEGLEITPWAASPALFNPTNIDIDHLGRVWVAEGVNYRRKGGPAAGRRPDRDSGRHRWRRESRQLQGLLAGSRVGFPARHRGFRQCGHRFPAAEFAQAHRREPRREIRPRRPATRGKSCSPASTGKTTTTRCIPSPPGRTGNGISTKATPAAFSPTSPARNSPSAAPITKAAAASGRSTPRRSSGETSGDGFVYVGGFTVRMNPDGTHAEIIGNGYRNSYEQTINSRGYVFQNDNDDPPACRTSHVLEHGNAGFFSADGKRSWQADQRPGQDTPTAHWRQENPGTMPSGDVYGGGSPTGIAFYENGALGEKFTGTLLSCEAARNVIFGYQPAMDGAGFKLERTDFLTTNPEKQFDGADFTGGAKKHGAMSETRQGPVQFPPVRHLRRRGRRALRRRLDRPPRRRPRHPGRRRLRHHLPDRAEGIQTRRPENRPHHRGRSRARPEVPGGQRPLARLSEIEIHRPRRLRRRRESPRRSESLRRLPRHLAAALPRRKRPRETRFPHRRHPMPPPASPPSARSAAPTGKSTICPTPSSFPPIPRRKSAPRPRWPMRYRSFEQAREVLVNVATRYDGKDRAYLESLGLGAGHHTAELWKAVGQKLQPGEPEKWSDTFARLTWRLMPEAAVPSLKARAAAENLSAGPAQTRGGFHRLHQVQGVRRSADGSRRQRLRRPRSSRLVADEPQRRRVGVLRSQTRAGKTRADRKTRGRSSRSPSRKSRRAPSSPSPT